MRATQHPQEQIPLPSECDIVVCLLWSRLGTRLPEKISAGWQDRHRVGIRKRPPAGSGQEDSGFAGLSQDEGGPGQRRRRNDVRGEEEPVERTERVPHALVQGGRRHVQGRLQNIQGDGPVRGLAGKGPAQAHPGAAQADASGREDLAPRAVPGPGGFRLRACADLLWPHARIGGFARPWSSRRRGAARSCWSSA